MPSNLKGNLSFVVTDKRILYYYSLNLLLRVGKSVGPIP
jgi:hypothetical protein